MKDVLYYSTLTGHDISDDVVVVGLCPSSNDVRSRSDTYWRLKNWMNIVGQYAYDFYNVIPDIVDEGLHEDVVVVLVKQVLVC